MKKQKIKKMIKKVRRTVKKKLQQNNLKTTIVDIPQQVLLQQLPPETESSIGAAMHPHHKMVYIVFFIVLFFVIALIALIKYAPMGDSAGKAIDVFNANAKCEDKTNLVTLSDSLTNIETYLDSCNKVNDVYIAEDYSCNTIDGHSTIKKELSSCNYGCTADGVTCAVSNAAKS